MPFCFTSERISPHNFSLSCLCFPLLLYHGTDGLQLPATSSSTSVAGSCLTQAQSSQDGHSSNDWLCQVKNIQIFKLSANTVDTPFMFTAFHRIAQGSVSLHHSLNLSSTLSWFPISLHRCCSLIASMTKSIVVSASVHCCVMAFLSGSQHDLHAAKPNVHFS